ncbi:MAG: hypothetical protein OEM24_08525 [Paracoccaceae bacterium]|nr:hypothetical protein [Paracoccaceae bacterium]
MARKTNKTGRSPQNDHFTTLVRKMMETPAWRALSPKAQALYGSGRTSGRQNADEVRSLDINWLRREGYLRPGYSGGLHWTRDGERVASIGVRMEVGRLRLIYRISTWGEDFESVDYAVPIRWCPCTLGGERPYFACPGIRNGRHCGRAVVMLYGAGRYFLCRHCYDLAYGSQWERPADRLLRQANKRRMRLGGEPGTASPMPRRPKGMWRKSYEREVAAILEAEELADAHFMAWMLRRYGSKSTREALATW